MRLIYRPIEVWPGKRTTNRRNTPFEYKTTWTSTLEVLERELLALRVDEAVLQVDSPTERHFRVTGELRADARLDSPAVILSFETRKYGKLSYPCDTFCTLYSGSKMEDWQHNVRAIALGLEALRKVERYGIANTGQQYTGWAQLPPATPLGLRAMTPDEAAQFIADAAHIPTAWPNILTNPDIAESSYRLAAKALHPDAGGSTADFQRLQEAKELLDKLVQS